MKTPELSALNIDLSSEDITAAILRECKADSPPTDTQKILDYFGLKRTYIPVQGREGSEIEGFGEGIRAALDIERKMIFLSPILGEKQHNFSTFHELGHFVLPEHRGHLYRCSQEDLGQFAKMRMEYESNSFAADCIFQLNRFIDMAMELPRNIRSIVHLADQFQASYESALIRYVERNPIPTAAVVYVRDGEISDDPPLRVQYFVRSKSFTYFTVIEPNQKVPRDDVLYDLVNVKSINHTLETPLHISISGGEKKAFETVCFTNSYKIFQVIFGKSSSRRDLKEITKRRPKSS